MSSLGLHLKKFGVCCYANVVKEKKKTQIMINHKTFMKTHNFPKTKHQLPHEIKKINFGSTKSLMGPLNDDN